MTEQQLSEDDRKIAAAGDLNVLAILMFLGSAGFAFISWLIGTIGWIAALATALSTLGTAIGLLRRNDVIAAFVKIGFGVSGLLAPVIGITGLVLAIFGFQWGWGLLGGAIVYFGFSLLGLEILRRAEDTGVIQAF